MKKKLSIIAIILSFFSLFLLGCETQNESIEQTAGEMTVHYIDVGQGDSILIQVNNKNLLIDAGPGKSKDMLLNYLDSLNLKKIDYVNRQICLVKQYGNVALGRKYMKGLRKQFDERTQISYTDSVFSES